MTEKTKNNLAAALGILIWAALYILIWSLWLELLWIALAHNSLNSYFIRWFPLRSNSNRGTKLMSSLKRYILTNNVLLLVGRHNERFQLKQQLEVVNCFQCSTFSRKTQHPYHRYIHHFAVNCFQCSTFSRKTQQLFLID